MSAAADLASKVLGALAAVLGLAGYVFVLGAAILWLRLREAGLPPVVPVSLATRQELITIGSQAAAVWVLLAAALGALAAWIVSGSPQRRRFGFLEAGLAVTLTGSALLALEFHRPGFLALSGTVALLVLLAAIYYWPSLEAVVAILLPSAVGLALAVGLYYLGNVNHTATAIGAMSVFAALLLATPWLQRWHARQEANRKALERIEAMSEKKIKVLEPLIKALEGGSAKGAPALWVGRIASVSALLLLFGVLAIVSQLNRNEDFEKALVALGNGDCIRGTYVVRGSDQLVLAEPKNSDADNSDGANPRILTIPTNKILATQVFAEAGKGARLHLSESCSGETPLLTPEASGPAAPKSDSVSKSSAENSQASAQTATP